MNNRGNVENLFPIEVLHFSVKKSGCLLTFADIAIHREQFITTLCVFVCVHAHASYCK